MWVKWQVSGRAQTVTWVFLLPTKHSCPGKPFHGGDSGGLGLKPGDLFSKKCTRCQCVSCYFLVNIFKLCIGATGGSVD